MGSLIFWAAAQAWVQYRLLTNRGHTVFHKPKLLRIYVKKEYTYLLRTVFLLLASYFFTDIYYVIESGVATARNGVLISVQDEPTRYWFRVSYKATLLLFSVYFIFAFRVRSAMSNDVDNPE